MVRRPAARRASPRAGAHRPARLRDPAPRCHRLRDLLDPSGRVVDRAAVAHGTGAGLRRPRAERRHPRSRICRAPVGARLRARRLSGARACREHGAAAAGRRSHDCGARCRAQPSGAGVARSTGGRRHRGRAAGAHRCRAGHGEAGERAWRPNREAGRTGCAQKVPTRRPSPVRAVPARGRFEPLRPRPSCTCGSARARAPRTDRRSPSSGSKGSRRLCSPAPAAREFVIRRDAGVMTFDGTFHAGVGAGTYTFTPSASFPAELVKRGFARPTPADQYLFASRRYRVRVPRRADDTAVRATGPAHRSSARRITVWI